MSKTRIGIGTVFALAAAITVIISPNLTDPVILPKFLVLLTIAFPLFVYTLKNGPLKKLPTSHFVSWSFFRGSPLLVLASLFLILHGVSALVSQSPTTGLLGVSGRRNGFLTYLGFFLLFLLGRKFANKDALGGFFFALSCVGGFESIYMLVQRVGMDPVPWNFVYANTMIGTLGNPDFASAFVALSAPATMYMVYLNIKDKKKVATFLTLLLTQITALLVSNVYQGPMALALAFLMACAFLVLFVKPNFKSKVLVITGVCISAIVTILGVLGNGPLSSIFAKRSFQIRIHAYWETATEMGLRHPFFGVGPDQFADQFSRFYSIENKKVFGMVLTDNAHNFFLQFFAEIGFFGAFIFLLLSLTVMVKAFRDLTHKNSNDLALKLAVIATLTVYFAQALISLEHIAINIWFWILLGLLSGKTIQMSTTQDPPIKSPKDLRTIYKTKESKDQFSGFNKVGAITAGILLVTLASLIYRLDNKVWKIEQSFKSQQGSDLTQQDLSSLKIATERWPYDAQLVTRASSLLLTFGQDSGLERLKRAISLSPESAPALTLLASYNEQKVNRGFGIEAREKLVILQPYEETNYVELIRDYLYVKQPAKAEKLRIKLMSFASPETRASVDVIIKEYYSG